MKRRDFRHRNKIESGILPFKPLVANPKSIDQFKEEGYRYTKQQLQLLGEQVIQNPQIIGKTKYFYEMITPKRQEDYNDPNQPETSGAAIQIACAILLWILGMYLLNLLLKPS